MPKRRYLTVIVALAIAESACSSISPGLHLREDKVRAERVTITPITPDVIVAQAEERARRSGDRARDPLQGTALGWQYRVSPFDVLSVIVWDHPELTIPAGEFRSADSYGNMVQADGSMFYPHAGVINVAGKTLPEVRALLTERLTRYVENPQLDVRVAAFRGKRVLVTGEVLQPMTLPITDVPLRVQDAIAAAKGLTPNAWLRAVRVTRGGKVHRLDLQALYEEGDLSQDWLLLDGDVLHVPSREANKVYVLGEVRQPSSKLMIGGRMSLAEAIGDSAGFDPLTSNPGAVFVLRGRYDASTIFKLDASNADALLLAAEFQLEPHDVVYVSTYKLTDWNRVMLQILPTVQGIWQTLDIGNRATTAIEGISR